MKSAAFAYYAPRSAEEALHLLDMHRDDETRIIAGGQSLVPMMAYRLARPAHLIDINGISELGTMTVDADVLRIGAGVRHTAFYDVVAPEPIGAFLQNVVRHIADHPIRVRGTFGGSIAHADPASEWCCIAVMLDAEIVVRNARSERSIAASAFFHGPMTTDVRTDELITEIRIPILPAETRCGFAEFSRRPGDFAIAMVAASYTLAGGRITEARLAVGGVEGRPRRILEAERALTGAAPASEAFREAASVAAAAVEPIDDGVDDAAFRRSVLLALVPQALERAA